jgi:hypothetical protein
MNSTHAVPRPDSGITSQHHTTSARSDCETGRRRGPIHRVGRWTLAGILTAADRVPINTPRYMRRAPVAYRSPSRLRMHRQALRVWRTCALIQEVQDGLPPAAPAPRSRRRGTPVTYVYQLYRYEDSACGAPVPSSSRSRMACPCGARMSITACARSSQSSSGTPPSGRFPINPLQFDAPHCRV